MLSRSEEQFVDENMGKELSVTELIIIIALSRQMLESVEEVATEFRKIREGVQRKFRERAGVPE